MSTYSADILATSGLLAYWRLGESVGPSAADSKGTNTGTYVNAPTFAQTGALSGDSDTAVTFASASSQDVTAASPTAATDNWALECWVRLPAVSAQSAQFAYNGNALTDGWGPGLGDGAGSSGLKLQGRAGGAFFHDSGYTFADTNWHHVVMTRQSGTIKYYVDGVQTGNTSVSAPVAPSNFFRIAAARNSTTDSLFFNGSVDEVAVYNAAMTAATALDHYQAGKLTGPYGPVVLTGPRPSFPSLGLSVEVTLADGSRKRWDSKGAAADRPQGLQFRTRQGDGFSDASVTLARRIDTDYIDLNLLDDAAFVGDDGSTAYEGRVMGIPRSMGDTQAATVNCAGWMSHARDRKFTEIYVDRDFSAWGEMPLNRKVAVAAANISFADFAFSTDVGGLVCALPNQALGTQTIAEAWYIAPIGSTVGKFMYSAASTAKGLVYESNALFSPSNDAGASLPSTAIGNPFDGALHSVTPAAVSRYAMLRVYSNGTAGTPAAGANDRYIVIGVYGNHGLTTRTIDSTTPDGVYASDVITNIAQRFCPRLSTAGVQSTTYPIPHLVFKDPTDPYDAFLDVNKFHLWDLGVWENKTLTFRPYDLSDYDWEIRDSDLGTTVALQGDSADDVDNGICVNYTDVATGLPARITPTDDATLADTSTTNPVNTHGLTKWTELTLSAPTTAVAAAQIGRIALAEVNSPKAPGTITVTGHIKDRGGHWQQGWKVRAGDTVAITDHPNDRPRLVTETTWDHDSKTLTISVEGPAHRLDAVLDRISTALVAGNLA